MLAMMMSGMDDDDGDVEVPSMPPPAAFADYGSPTPEPAPVLGRSPFSRDDLLEAESAAPVLTSFGSAPAPAAGTGRPVFGAPDTYAAVSALEAAAAVPPPTIDTPLSTPAALDAPPMSSATGILAQQRVVMQAQQAEPAPFRPDPYAPLGGGGGVSHAAAGAI